MTRKLTLLLIVSLFYTTTYVSSHELDDSELFSCTHDHKERPEPELLDLIEHSTGDERILASSRSFRTYAYYGLLASTTSAYKSYIQNDLVPPLMSYLEGALNVKYPVNGNLKIANNVKSICGVAVPSVLRSGVPADYVYFIEADYDTSSNWVAESVTCNLDTSSKRPLVGKTTINRNLLKDPGNDILLHEKNMVCILHEIFHTLGFSSSLYKHFVDDNGRTLTGHVKKASLGSGTSTVIDVEPLTKRLRAFFGCSTLSGAYMENSGSSATAGSHFERRQFAFEAMTSGLIYEMQFSQFSLALLEGSGWYVPNYDYADNYFWGQGQGCNFLTKSCSSSGFSFDEFCKSSNNGCSFQGGSAGNCASDARSDGCKFVHPKPALLCESEGTADYVKLPSLQAFGRNAGSKCFTGSLSSSKASAGSYFCFKYSCSGSGSNTVLDIKVGSQTVTCTNKGSKSVSGYSGTVDCPDPLTFCSTVGKKTCPRGCMGRGDCVNGTCSCYNGYKGKDCGLNS